ncbi:FliC/FljB family flagellin [Providencia alcalifaciens]|uniref:FliC/FljB family flagellin n=1 Tax=Providencia alcalifaciens TaxID=126385 RepID=UPI000448B84B|nr:FliC/FljB family flagellin [Providencia alcalifaciens]ETT03826.1 flagellin 1 [Providencia alcalifaciens F90-2004]EUC95144.1 flagellin 1 [Providencia alcalifaciens PAL-2]MTB34480.1 FliC/FljB family flagellin [Providencia alcalifaciens]MTC99898.1 FliC/FljB family flagellin [Providencia alcalifaciens]
MAQVINTNILSLTTQNNLNRSQGVLGTAIERLSSGSRINSAKDDAAGQAIANRFTANVKGLTQAARNANDGISIAQTAEGAVNEINDNLQRVRELTVQAQNGTNSKSDIESINKEVTARMDEINRISEQTQFNGVKVLSEDTSMKIQVGTNDSETIAINLKKIDSEVLGLKGFDASASRLGAVVSANDFAADIKGTGTDAEALTAAKAGLDGIKFGGKDVEGAKVYYQTDATTGAVDKTKVYITGTVDGKEVELKAEVEATPATTGPDVAAKLAFKNVAELDDADKKVLDDKGPLGTLDKALATVDSLRSDLGAIQNRMQSTINNLNNSVNNLSAARSRIQDADFATEVSNMSRGQILQQAGTAVLAQANQVPQGVLSLLR